MYQKGDLRSEEMEIEQGINHSKRNFLLVEQTNWKCVEYVTQKNDDEYIYIQIVTSYTLSQKKHTLATIIWYGSFTD